MQKLSTKYLRSMFNEPTVVLHFSLVYICIEAYHTGLDPVFYFSLSICIEPYDTGLDRLRKQENSRCALMQ
jgi:hypothetical protein